MWVFLEQKRVARGSRGGTRTCGNWLAGAGPGIYPAHATRLQVFPLSKHRRSFQVPKVAHGSASLAAATRAKRRCSRQAIAWFPVSSRNMERSVVKCQKSTKAGRVSTAPLSHLKSETVACLAGRQAGRHMHFSGQSPQHRQAGDSRQERRHRQQETCRRHQAPPLFLKPALMT